MSDDQTLQQLREQAQAIATRANEDPAYAQQIRDDPVATLTASGVPEDVVQRLVQGKTVKADDEEGADVEGYMFCRDGTCWYGVSLCPGSCYITF